MSHPQRSNFTNWIFNSFEVSNEGLGLYRIFSSFYILFFLLPSTSIYVFIGSVPADFYAPPPGLFSLLSDFPPEWLLYVLHYLLITGLFFMLFGCFTKFASLLTGSMLFLLKGFMFGLGKIDHELLMIIIPVLMAFSRWGKAYSVDKWRNAKTVSAQSWVLTLLALMIGFMFFTAGFPKILGGWLDLSTHATEGHFYKQYFVRGRQDLLAQYALNFNGVIWEISDYTTVLFEIGFIFAVLKASATRLFICLAVLFHFSIMLILNIPFLPNFLAYAAFFNWTWLTRIIKHGTSKITQNERLIYYSPPFTVALIMSTLFLCIYFLKNHIVLQSDLTLYAIVLVSVFTAIAVVCLIKITVSGISGVNNTDA